MSLRERLSRLFDATDESWKSAEPVPPIQRGIIKRHGQFRLCSPWAEVRGVKLVTVSYTLCERHDSIMRDYEELQRQLSELPTSLRPRVRKAAE